MVLIDENGFGQDELDSLCYRLAHTHQIVTKSVQLPAPVYRGARDGRMRNHSDLDWTVSTISVLLLFRAQ